MGTSYILEHRVNLNQNLFIQMKGPSFEVGDGRQMEAIAVVLGIGNTYLN